MGLFFKDPSKKIKLYRIPTIAEIYFKSIHFGFAVDVFGSVGSGVNGLEIGGGGACYCCTLH